MNEKKILHLDMDAFFASVEQAANPHLKGKALIVGGRANRKRTVVCAASYEAKRLGVDSGMSCQEAFRLCPQAEFVAADSEKYLYVSSKIFKLLKNYSPQIEQASVDEFYLDVTGMHKIFGSYVNLALEIKDRIKRKFHITGSIGISINRLMSKIASKLYKPDGLTILEKEDIANVLADLPVEKIPGIGRSLTERLNRFSIFSFAELQKQSLEFFLEKFGKAGLWMYALVSLEEDQEQISWLDQEQGLPKSIGHSYTLTHNIYQRQEIEAWIRLLCEMVGFRLRRILLESNTLHLFLKKPNLAVIAKEKNFKSPTNDPDILCQRALFILDKLEIKNISVRALGVTARDLSPAANIFLFADQRKRAQVLRTQDKINEKFGDWTLYPAGISLIR